MKEKTIRVLKVAPKMTPEVVMLDNNLEVLQRAVSVGADYVGLIEIIDIDDKACILCNEEGKLIQLEPNRRFYDDVICGVFYVTGQSKNGELTSLSDSLIEYYKKMFGTPEDISPDEVEDAFRGGFFIM